MKVNDSKVSGFDEGDGEMIQLIHGDCLEEMKKIPDKSIDLVLTSPPYNKTGFRGRSDMSKGKGRWKNANIVYGEFTDDMDEIDYQIWQVKIIDEAFRIIKATGSIFYNHKIRRANKKASSPMKWILRSKAIFYQEIVWNRMSGVDHNIGYLDPITERIYWLIKDTPKCHKDPKWATEIWNIAPLPDDKHPAPFPLKLCKVAIQLTTDENDLVIDPFCGIGTVGIACKELKRNFIGIDNNPDYIKMAKKRIANTQESMF